MKSDLCEIAQFSGIVGCVDGSPISIIEPKENEYVYVNRRNFHAVYVQAVFDADFIFQDVVAKWPTISSRFFYHGYVCIARSV